MTAPGRERAIIIGGGVVGLGCAHHLVEAGLEVTVVDRGAVGGGCSHGNLGFVCPSHVLPLNEPGAVREGLVSLFRRDSPLRIKPQLRLGLYRWMVEFARRCTHEQMLESGRRLQPLLESSMAAYQDLFDVLGEAGDWHQAGLVYGFRNGRSLEEFAELDALLTETYGITAQRIDRLDLPNFDPALRADLAGAFHYSGDGAVRPETLIVDWHRHLANRGVTFIEHRPITGVHRSGGHVIGLDSAAGELDADHYVFAAGAWSPQFARWLDCRIPVEAGKGYSLTTSRPDPCPVHPMLFPEHRIGVAPFPGGLRIGSMMEFAGLDTSLPPRRIDQLRRSASHYLHRPSGDETDGTDQTDEIWYGWRPMTWDSLPIIGRVPGLDNAVLATGHNMLGVTLAAATGRLVRELIEGRPPHVDIGAFSPARFG